MRNKRSKSKFKFLKNLRRYIKFLYPVYIMLSFIIGYFIGLILLKLTNVFTPKAEFLSDVAAFEAIIIGVAIPISSQIFLWIAERYEDIEITKFFIRDGLYRFLKWSLIINIAFAIFFRFIDLRYLNSWYVLFLWIIFLWLILNMALFIFFIKRVEAYISKVDELLIKLINKNVKKILSK